MRVSASQKNLRIALLDSNETRRQMVIGKLHKLAGAVVQSSCSDLSEGFNFVEHNPPDIILVSESLAKLSEFEMIRTLCQVLSVRISTFRYSQSPGQVRDGLDFAAGLADIQEAIRAAFKNPEAKLRGSSSGLLNAPKNMGRDRLVLIGSSTGGLEALLTVLGSFPARCPPTVIVQHTGAGFSEGLVRLLDKKAAPVVKLAENGEPVQAGKVLIAPSGDTHLNLEGRSELKCRLDIRDKISGHRPSIDVLFSSAVPVASRTTAVIMTGMGRDGSDGMLKLRQSGATTIAQDEASCVVYGMPRVAVEIGAVQKILPLEHIGPTILKSSIGALH